MKEIDKKSASELLSDGKPAMTKMQSLQDQIDFELNQALNIIDSTIENEEAPFMQVQLVEQVEEGEDSEVNSEFLELSPEESNALLSNLLETKTEAIENVHELASMIEETLDLIEQEEIMEREKTNNVVALGATTKFAAREETNSIQFQMSGQTELKLLIGNHETSLNLNTQSGIELSIADIKITINETQGCHIESKNGINFTIPLSIDVLEHKKKAA